MKHLKILTLITFIIAALTSCTDDLSDFGTKECVVGKPVSATLDFGNGGYEDVTITTRGTFDGTFEHLVKNLYVLIFKSTDAGNGEKVYGHFFDVKNKEFNIEDVSGYTADKSKQCWAVVPATSSGKVDANGYKIADTPTHGAVRVKTPSGGPYNIYIIANIQDAYLDLSPEMFDGMQNETEMLNHFVNLENEPITRTAMLMIGSKKNVYVHDNGSITEGVNQNSQKVQYVDKTNNNALKLQRIDAKIEVRVHVDPTKDNPDLDKYGIKANKVKDFHPQSWEVVNLTNRTQMVDTHANGANPLPNPEENKKIYYYNSGPKNFEEEKVIEVGSDGKKVNVTDYRFSFYMFENYQKEKVRIEDGDYHKRDLRKKDASGKYDTSNDEMWQYAPERGSYLKITGQVEMDYSETNNVTGKAQTLYADVTYYVHLGDFKSDKGMNDYDVRRDTRYTYNITIVDVNKIIVEVQTSQPDSPNEFAEDQSGATGNVFIAKQKICLFDAHYGQTVLCFYAQDINDDLTWYVRTPFNKDGVQPSDGVAADYLWVKFARNLLKRQDNSVVLANDEGANPELQHYSKLNRWYLGDSRLNQSNAVPNVEKLMNVKELVAYLQEEKRKLEKNQANDFRKETIEVINGTTTNKAEVDVIYVTAFIDDYYYDKDPIADASIPNLWTKFVNDCGPRMMHILCDNKRSLDGESSYTNSVFTIRQTPIQTVYNTDINTAPAHAWGCETVDENGASEGNNGLNYGSHTSGDYFDVKDWNTSGMYDVNTAVDGGSNGMYNTWNMCGFNGTQSWADYLVVYNNGYTKTPLYWELPESYDASNTSYTPTEGAKPEKDNIHFIKNKHWLYSFLPRNRDHNGDGVIDKNEIEWYIASLDQLQILFIGSEGLSGESQIYPDKYARASGNLINGINPWRLHLISSTIKEKGRPAFLWAEEGVSVSNSKEWGAGTAGVKGVRCVRNLGTAPWNGMGHPQIYDPVIVVTEDFANNRVNFDARRLNRKSLRGNGIIDPLLETLQTTDEYGLYSLIPRGFTVYLNTSNTADIYTWKGHNGSDKYDELKNVLDNNIQLAFPENNATKPTATGSWRMPNIREMAVIYAYYKNILPNQPTYVATTTYFSLGRYGSQKGGDNERACWFFNNAEATMNVDALKSAVNYILVRDWQPY